MAVLVAAICTQVTSLTASEQGLLKIQLHKQQQPSAELSYILAHQQARVQRRAQEAGNADGDSPVGAFALSEAPLGVGYGCVKRLASLKGYGYIY